MRVVDRRGHRDDDEICLCQHGGVGAAAQLRGRAQFVAADFTGRVEEALVRGNLLGRHVEAERAVLLAELDGERQTHVSETDDGNGGRGGIGHERSRSNSWSGAALARALDGPEGTPKTNNPSGAYPAGNADPWGEAIIEG